MIGRRLGPYEIEAELGSGGMGRVYRAKGPRGVVALKVVHPHLLEAPGFFKRFLREAALGKQVVHPNVIRTLDVDAITVEGVQHNFLIMEYVEGQTLRALLQELRRVPEELCRHIGREVARGLRAIHDAGIIHRDLKPENVLLTPDHQVKIMDLGVARLANEALRLSHTGIFVGSVLYAAPEQFTGTEPDGRADLFALGLILYELATGQLPGRAEDFHLVMRARLEEEPRAASELNPQLSPFFEEVVHGLLARDPTRRLRSVETVLAEGEDGLWWRERARTIRERTKRPLRRIRIPRETALYGREEELNRLHRLFAAAREGRGRVALVEGEAGIGKTRLVDEFVASLRRDATDFHFLFGTYPSGGAATEAGAFSTAYREHYGAEGLEGSLADPLAAMPAVVPAFAALLRGTPVPPGAAPLTKDSLQSVFVHVTRELARERPTVVLVEDLHFAPREGLALFAALAQALAGQRVLLLGTARRGLAEDWTASLERLDHVRRLPLPRLSPKDLEKVLVEALGSRRIADELGWEIATKSDGNPYFVFEILKTLRESGSLTRQADGTWATTGRIGPIRVPSSVSDLIRARLAKLEEEDREILDVAACCGFRFDGSLVAGALGVPAIPVLRRLARIEGRHFLVRSAGREFVFDHHQLHEALLQRLPASLREAYHLALGDAMERRFADCGRTPDGAAAVALCEHFLAGGAPARARSRLVPAMDHLTEGNLYGDVADLAERALRADGLLEGAERADILLRQWTILEYVGRKGDQMRVAEEAERLARACGDPVLLARARRVVGDSLRRQARLAEAEAVLLEACALAVEAGDRKAEARTWGVLGNTYFHMGRFEEAVAAHRRDAELEEEIGDRGGQVVARGNIATLLQELGRLDEAVAETDRALALARELGSRHKEAAIVGNRGLLLFDRGHLGDALGHFRACLETNRSLAVRRGETIARINIASVLRALGRLEDAREEGERALELALEMPDLRLQGYALHALGDVDSAEGRLDAARERLDASLALRRERGYEGDLAPCLLSLGRLEQAQGHGAAAARSYEEALRLGEEHKQPKVQVVAAAYRAGYPGGDVPAALELLGRWEGQLGSQPVLEARFALWKATGDRSHLAEARRLLGGLVEHAPADARESMASRVPLHRDILEASTAAAP